jgi:hypothetical protein
MTCNATFGCPPCPRPEEFGEFLDEKCSLEVVIGWQKLIQHVATDEETRPAYD